MHVVSEHELNLSAKLYGLLGGLSAEITQLPTERTVRDWTEGEVLHSVCRCKDALIDALRCALRLSQLGELDEISRQWIAEVLQYSEEDQALLEHVEDVLAHECRSSLP